MTSHNARIALLNEQLRKATNARIRTMKEGEIRNAMADYEQHMEKLERAVDKADILPETLAYGLLVVEAEASDNGSSHKFQNREQVQ